MTQFVPSRGIRFGAPSCGISGSDRFLTCFGNTPSKRGINPTVGEVPLLALPAWVSINPYMALVQDDLDQAMSLLGYDGGLENKALRVTILYVSGTNCARLGSS